MQSTNNTRTRPSNYFRPRTPFFTVRTAFEKNGARKTQPTNNATKTVIIHPKIVNARDALQKRDWSSEGHVLTEPPTSPAPTPFAMSVLGVSLDRNDLDLAILL